MNDKNVKQMAEIWGVTERQVQNLCKNGVVVGARKIGRDWLIPENVKKPIDKRTKEGKKIKDEMFNLPMPKKTPFLDMTSLYHTPGMAKECGDALLSVPEAKLLFEAEIAYSRGDVDKVYKYAKYFLNSHSGFYSAIAGGMLLAHCAMWRGDINLWNEAKKHMCEIKCKNDVDRDIVALSLAASNSSINYTADFPDWFCRGDFEFLPADALPAARVFYIKYLMIFASDLAKNRIEIDGMQGLGLMRTIPYLVEPMISQSMADKTIMVELYLRILVAIAYNNIGDVERSVKNIDKAIEIALPDMLLGSLAEHRRELGYLLDERIKLADAQVFKEYKKMYKTLHEGWHKLHNIVHDKDPFASLSTREREISKLAAFGLTDKEISVRLNIAISSVKSIITMAKNKTGVKKRSDLGAYI